MASFGQLGRQARQAIKDALEPSERIEAAIAGASGSALVATNRRVFIFKKGAGCRRPRRAATELLGLFQHQRGRV